MAWHSILSYSYLNISITLTHNIIINILTCYTTNYLGIIEASAIHCHIPWWVSLALQGLYIIAISIIYASAKANFGSIVNWIHVAFRGKSEENQPSLLLIPRPITPLMDGDFICNYRNILFHCLPLRCLSVQRYQGFKIYWHIGEVVVELLNKR